VIPGTEGFCNEEEKPFGPVQLYVAPAMKLAVRFNVCPTHSGLLLPAVGAAGTSVTVTVTVPARLGQPSTVAMTE